MKHFIFVLILSSFFGHAFAANLNKFSDQKTKKIVTNFYLSKLLKIDLKNNIDMMDGGVDPICPPYPPYPGPGNSVSCMEAICTKLGSYGCDDQSEISRVAQLCSAQFDGNCVQSVCAKLGSYGCDDFAEVQRVAGICAGNYGSYCVDAVCPNLGSYGCDDFADLQRVAMSCSRVSYTAVECLKYSCKKLGSYGCDSFDEVDRVLKSCNGH